MTKISKTVLFLFIFISLFQFNCTSIPVYRLEPGESTSEWYYGRQVLTKKDNIANVQLTFEESSENSYFFYMEITNCSEKTIIVDPAEIYFEKYHPVSGQSPIILEKIYAYNPEQKIISIDKSINKANTQENKRRGLSCIVSTVDFVSSVSKAGKSRTKEEIEKENRERENRRIDNQNAEVEYKEKINNLNDEKSYWQNEAFRKTSIKPGMKAEGSFCIPIPTDAKYLKLVIPVENNIFEFEYKQIRL